MQGISRSDLVEICANLAKCRKFFVHRSNYPDCVWVTWFLLENGV